MKEFDELQKEFNVLDDKINRLQDRLSDFTEKVNERTISLNEQKKAVKKKIISLFEKSLKLACSKLGFEIFMIENFWNGMDGEYRITFIDASNLHLSKKNLIKVKGITIDDLIQGNFYLKVTNEGPLVTVPLGLGEKVLKEL